MTKAREIANSIYNKKLNVAKELVRNELYRRAHDSVENMKPEVMGNLVREEEVDLEEDNLQEKKWAAYDPNTGELEKVFSSKKDALKWQERQHDPSMADPKYKKMGKDVETEIRPYKD